jgi:nucleotide-binding universal stress UspA family protein
MIKTILVPVEGLPADESALATALLAAKAFDAHLAALHVRIDPAEVVAATATVGLGVGVGMTDMMGELERDAVARAAKARATFDAAVSQSGIALSAAPAGGSALSAEWRDQTDHEPERVIAAARASDLVVIGRAGPDGSALTPTMEAALMDSGTPVLVAPATAPKALFGTVVIAWKPTAQATRAVSAAMPFLAQAKRVVVVSIGEAESNSADASAGIVGRLQWHGFPVEQRHVAATDKPAAETLLAVAAELGADLLVMGGFSHSRVREMIFGGFTQRVLTHADVPVFILH